MLINKASLSTLVYQWMEAREAVMSLPEEGFDMMVSTSGRVNPSESRPCIASRAKGHMLK